MKANKSSTDEAAGSRKRKRKRLSDVRGRVLGLLAAGPMTSAQLVSSGGFSAASLYLNLKSLKKDGMVSTQRDGRSVVISLADGVTVPADGAGAAAVGSRRRGRPPRAAGTPRKGSGSLSQALAGLSSRLSPIARLDEKLLVLKQLGHSLPAPVAGVLREIIDDLTRRG